MNRSTVGVMVGLLAGTGALSVVGARHHQPLIQTKLRSEALRQLRVVPGLGGVSVEAVDGRNLVLGGAVQHGELVRRATAIASRIPGVRRVVNRIEVERTPTTVIAPPPASSGGASLQRDESRLQPWLSERLEGLAVVFGSRSDELTPHARWVLDGLAFGLAGQPRARVEIGGHTDEREPGATSSGLDLGRARAVCRYLGRALDVRGFQVPGYGPSRRNDDSPSRDGRHGRRVEFRVIEEESA